MNRKYNYEAAIQDFQSAHLRAKLEGLLARITGKSNELLSYEDVASKLKLQGRSDRGRQTIPVDAIVGSVGRYTDFTRTFLPRNAQDKRRWANVKVSAVDPLGVGLPPVEVYKVSDVYFVLDGNHRVSVAKQEGWKTIEAYVIEVQSDIPLTPDIQPDDLIVRAEYADFLKQTELNRSREQIDLRLTIPNQYQRLLDEISARRDQLQEEEHKDWTVQAAAENWYREIYLPFAEAVRDRGMMRWFPNRTVTDLYVWMSEHRQELERDLGWNIRPEAAAEELIQKRVPDATEEESRVGSWRKARLLTRYLDNLFRDILVPISPGAESWEALEQAIQIAHREQATILGLHTVESAQQLESPAVLALREQFEQTCSTQGVQGILAIETGEPTQKILERAALTDLIVMKISYPPSPGVRALASNVRTLIARSSRPILAIPAQVSNLTHALLAFDGSPKAREALFVAAYLAEQWHAQLTVFAGLTGENADPGVEAFARDYLEFNEIEARFITERYSAETLKNTADEIGADLLIMGSYHGSLLREVTVGSSVNSMLRESEVPILICR